MSVLFRQKVKQTPLVILTSFLIGAFIIGIAGALQSPTLSRYLTDEVKVGSFWVGFFYSFNAIMGVIVSFIVAQYSDKKGDRRNIILFCCVMGIGNAITFAFTRNYYLLITVGICFSSLASSAMSQVFAIAREYAIKVGRNIVAFNAILRAQLSLAWVIGPPLSFFLAVNYGFTTMYLSAASMFIIAFVIVFIFFPSIKRNQVKEVDDHGESESILGNKNVICLFLATVFMWAANMMYLIDMPLYLDKVLNLSTSLPGQLMGLAAGIEIPVMLIAGFLVPYIGQKRLFCSAVVCGVIFYLGMILFTDEYMILFLQLFNGLFIGVVASIGIVYFQELMPNRAGIASTLFNNGISCGIVLAGLIQGSAASVYGHSIIYWIALLMVSVSLLFCAMVKPV